MSADEPSGRADNASADGDASGSAEASADGDAAKFGRLSGRKHPRRAILIGSGVAVLAVVSAVAWLLYSGLRARSELTTVRGEVRVLRAQIGAGDLDSARATARSVAQHARRAHSLTTGPVWALAGDIPYFGNPADTVRASTAGVASISDNALPLLIQASSGIDPSQLRRPDGSFDLALIQKAAPQLDRAARAMQAALHDVQAAPGSTWLGAVDNGRRLLLDQLAPLTRTVVNADVSARTVPVLLGADGPRSYLLSFQNEAELRGTGGLPAAFAIIRADHGALQFTRFESDLYLLHVPSKLDFGTDYDRLYTVGEAKPYQGDQDSNVSPNFPYAAQIWIAMWRAKTGQQLDGAMTVDPTALSYLLRATGPATLPDKSQVTAGNVVALTQSTAYDRFGENNLARKQFLLDIARAVSRHLIAGSANTTDLARAAGTAASQHRLLIWSRDPAVENLLAPTAISGTVPTTSAPYAGLAINNAAANKLDYYLHVALDWNRTGCGATRDVTVKITLTNEAPLGLPSYVQTPAGHEYPKSPTTNRLSLMYFATNGSSFTSVMIDSKIAGATSGLELGHPVFGTTIDLPRGRPRTIVFHLKEPVGTGSLIPRMQPMINPVDLSFHDAPCGS